ncbi:unnamed protein product [Prorocentrum cordatum]|uniref:Uncharacterized protein n=1 Tax=Prorocentrum cordatum TaxID=2364126 RepID=A0ABN9QV60_9DINO|nr:unnamed protein product [Polarella glacialis]
MAAQSKMRVKKGDSRVTKDGKVVDKAALTRARKSLSQTDKIALQWINDYLATHRAQILQTKANLESGQVDCQVEDQQLDIKDRPYFPDSYMHFGQLLAWWCADFLHEWLGYPQSLLDKMDVANTVKPTFTYITGLGDGQYWPRPCLQKRVLYLFAIAMAEKMGNRQVQFKAKIGQDGSVDFVKHGPFEYFFGAAVGEAEPVLERTVHKGTSIEAKNLPLRIDKGFKCTSPWSDANAKFVGATRWKPCVHELFNDPPFMAHLDKKVLSTLADTVVSANAALLTPKKKTVILSSKSAAKAAKAKAVAKARVPLAKLAAPFSA